MGRRQREVKRERERDICVCVCTWVKGTGMWVLCKESSTRSKGKHGRDVLEKRCIYTRNWTRGESERSNEKSEKLKKNQKRGISNSSLSVSYDHKTGGYSTVFMLYWCWWYWCRVALPLNQGESEDERHIEKIRMPKSYLKPLNFCCSCSFAVNCIAFIK